MSATAVDSRLIGILERVQKRSFYCHSEIRRDERGKSETLQQEDAPPFVSILSDAVDLFKIILGSF